MLRIVLETQLYWKDCVLYILRRIDLFRLEVALRMTGTGRKSAAKVKQKFPRVIIGNKTILVFDM